MINFKRHKAYSIAEALVTMLVIVLIILFIMPSVTGKKTKRIVHVVGSDEHGIVECKEGEDCEVQLPPGDVRDVFVIATGGGGGGAGSYCGDDAQLYMGAFDKDIKGSCKFKNDTVMYIDAAAAGGGSSQGFCDPYPGVFDAAEHKKKCNLFPKTSITRSYYGEAERVVMEWRCENESTTCKTYEKDKNGKDTSTCSEYNIENICRDRPVIPRATYWEETTLSSSSETMSCNKLNLTAACNPNVDPSPNPTMHSFPHIGNNRSYQKFIDYGESQEAIDTKRADVCEINWIAAPEVGDAKRYCNAALHGGRGGSGTYYKERLCPKGDPKLCTEWRGQHNISSYCSPEQLAAQAKSKTGACPFGVVNQLPEHSVNQGYLDKPMSEITVSDLENALLDLLVNMANGLLKTFYEDCNPETLRKELRKKGECGHDEGEFNCKEKHDDKMPETCNHWKLSSMSTKFLIGRAGEAGPGVYTSPGGAANNTELFVDEKGDLGGGTTTNDPGIVNMLHDMVLKGGDKGIFSKHGLSRGGENGLSGKGGGHNGMSKEYSMIPAPNTIRGEVGYVRCVEKFIEAGLGGNAGITQSGYLKNASGNIIISVGEGGSGGRGSAVGNIIVDLVSSMSKALFPNSYNPADSKKLEERISGADGRSGQDTVVEGGGQKIVAPGGMGGRHTRIYETCTANSSAVYNTETKFKEYDGRKGQQSETEHGHGGDGEGGAPGEFCQPTDGKDGTKGGVTIFY